MREKYLRVARERNRLLLALSASILLSSCASIFNSKSTDLRIYTLEETSISTNSEAVVSENKINEPKKNEHYLRVNRGDEILNVTLSSEDTTKTVSISSKNSFAYLLNFIPTPYAIGNIIGVLIDDQKPKRYTYPKRVYVDMESEGNDYTTYRPLKKAYQGFENVFKINFMQMASFEVGGVEISYEKKNNEKFSTQLSAAYILPSIWEFPDFKPRKWSGFQIGLEKRLYWQETAPVGYYLAGELNYLNSQYLFTDSFVASNEYYTIFYDDEFKVKKQTYSLNLKVGKQFFIKRLAIDLSIGAGLRYKNVKHLEKINPEGEKVDAHSFLLPDLKELNNRPGKYLAGSFPASIRIGWLF